MGFKSISDTQGVVEFSNPIQDHVIVFTWQQRYNKHLQIWLHCWEFSRWCYELSLQMSHINCGEIIFIRGLSFCISTIKTMFFVNQRQTCYPLKSTVIGFKSVLLTSIVRAPVLFVCFQMVGVSFWLRAFCYFTFCKMISWSCCSSCWFVHESQRKRGAP